MSGSAERQTRGDRRAKEHRAGRTLLHLLRGVAAAVSLALIIGTGMAYAYVNRLSGQAGTGANVSGLDGNEAATGINREDMDILMVGLDTRAGTQIPDEAGGVLNTDTMMLIHVPADGKAASVVSFPRDTYVPIPGYGEAKLNAAYPTGYLNAPEGSSEQQRRDAGQALLVQTINQLSGVQIDHFVTVTLAGFKELTAAVGGVDVVLCEPTSDPDSGANFPAGPQHLDADQALSFVRQRHDVPGQDLGRIKRQQYFMGALLRKVLDQGLLDIFNLDKLNGIIDAVAGTITYDEDLDPLALAEQMRPIAAGNVELHTIPIVGEGRVPGVGDVLYPATDADMKAFFRALSGEPVPAATPTPSPPSSSVAPADITIDVYDGTTIPGALQLAEKELSGKGFTVDNALIASTSDYATEVQYAEGDEDRADALVAAIPGSVKKQVASTPSEKIIVVIGANFPGLAASPTTTGTAEQTGTAAYDGCIY